MSPSLIVRDYYEAFARGDLETTATYVHPECRIDEPTFLPYGRIEVIGAPAMFRHIANTFSKVFERGPGLRDVSFFEHNGRVISNAVWHMTGIYTKLPIACYYQEYFEFRDGRISLMRPFYHSAREIQEAFAAAAAAGVDLTP